MVPSALQAPLVCRWRHHSGMTSASVLTRILVGLILAAAFMSTSLHQEGCCALCVSCLDQSVCVLWCRDAPLPQTQVQCTENEIDVALAEMGSSYLPSSSLLQADEELYAAPSHARVTPQLPSPRSPDQVDCPCLASFPLALCCSLCPQLISFPLLLLLCSCAAIQAVCD